MDQSFLENLKVQLHNLVFANDTETLRTVTKKLNDEFYVHNECLPGLVEIATGAPEWQVRQLAAVELRKQISKLWEKQDEKVKQQVREHLLKKMFEEQEKLTQHGLGRAVTSIARIDVPNNAWPGLVEFLYESCNSPAVSHREIGIYVLDSLLEMISETISDNFQPLMDLLEKLLNDPESLQVRVTAMEAMCKVGEYIEEKREVTRFQETVPAMARVLETCLQAGDEDNASKCFEVLNILLLLETPLLNKHLGEFVEFGLTVGSNLDLDSNLRVMALNFLAWAATYKRTRIQKLKIVPGLIERIMVITKEEDSDDISEESPSRVALRVLNVLSTNMPPAQVFPIVWGHVVQYMQSADPLERKGGMLALAITVEGSVDFVRSQVSDLVGVVSAGLRDSDSRVQKAACMALGCFAEELAAEISTFHKELLPSIINILYTSTSADTGKHACNALDAILEGLGESTNEYLPTLVPQLIALVDNGPSDVKVTAMAAIGSAAHASGKGFLPFFTETMQRIGKAMTVTEGDDEISLRGVATDTAGTMAEMAGKEAFLPYLAEIVQLTFQGMKTQHATLRDCGFCFFGVISRVFDAELEPYLPHIVGEALATFATEETLGESDGVDLISDEAEDEDENSDFNVSTAAAEEKEIAADCVAELFASTRAKFLPYVSSIVPELLKLLVHYSDTTRKSAVSSLFVFITTFNSMGTKEPWVSGVPATVPLVENVTSIVEMSMPPIMEMWAEEDSTIVVTQILVELREAMSSVGPALIQNYVQPIVENLQLLLQKKALCQMPDFEDDDEPVAGELAEYDSLLIGAAGDCVSELSNVMGASFVPLLPSFIPLFQTFSSPACAVAERSMAVGCMSEITKNLGAEITPATEPLYSMFMQGLADPEAEVMSNSAYGIGVLVLNSTVDWSTQFENILKALWLLFSKNTNASNLLDNACGSVARLILKLPDLIPYSDVLPVWLSCLPLKEDHMEDAVVYDAICYLIDHRADAVAPFADPLKNVIHSALSDPLTSMSKPAQARLSSL
ncbi:putative importin subunit beta-4 [Zancudomyces culisetae]|uniref:Putative importin subunit beta-4 n=1 Tax=Zancudomyces culisetae TaxID=1213189 RepID=A0A1R1PP41_ZANCU|nr:putative importin subunit beta-4 [Zancudomyces culisetae]|eukprot:OMH82724.1 putative importin subunit beta-4 [Zancudomyces culisetae]